MPAANTSQAMLNNIDSFSGALNDLMIIGNEGFINHRAES